MVSMVAVGGVNHRLFRADLYPRGHSGAAEIRYHQVKVQTVKTNE